VGFGASTHRFLLSHSFLLESKEQRGEKEVEDHKLADEKRKQHKDKREPAVDIKHVVEGLDPLSTQHAEDYCQRVPEVDEVPTGDVHPLLM
jgi:hypothetical protein